jgi:hypothetical protein
MDSKSVAIMQPTYLPWIGYFSLIDQVDIFVFLDKVQFDKRSWQQRNRIKTAQGELFLSVPVQTKGKPFQKICDVLLDKTQHYPSKHLKAIENSYSKARYYAEYWSEMVEVFNRDYKYLSDLNIALIQWFVEKLGIEVTFVKSRNLKSEGTKVELLVRICHEVGAGQYVSPLGSKGYIDKNNIFRQEKIDLSYQNYTHPEYTQLHKQFVPYMSMVDLLMNEGRKSLEIMRLGKNELIFGC